MEEDLNQSGRLDAHNNMMNISDVQNVVINAGMNQSFDEPKTPVMKSINTCRKPILNAKITSAYVKLYEKVKNFPEFLVLHCHGLAGTGKSTTVCRLAEGFPFFDAHYTVKWHIECDDQTHDLKTELVKMIVQMSESGLLSKPINEDHLMTEVKRDTANSLVKILCGEIKCDVPILILVEDMRQADKTFFCDFLRNLSSSQIETKIHIYIASRKQPFMLDQSECEGMSFISQKIEGFSAKEGQDYLMDSDEETTNENKAAAKKIVRWFSRSPLGLRTVKGLCRSIGYNYEEYLELLNSDVNFVETKEIKNLKKRDGESAVHIYQAISIPFANNLDKLLDWKILSCLAYLHHIRIPYFVINSLCQRFRPLPHSGKQKPKNKLECKDFINTMKENALCTSEDSDSDEEDGESGNTEYTSISCHEVVLHAFKLRPNQDIEPLESTIFSIASLSTKDMRDRQIANGMIKLLPHMYSLLEHCFQLEKEEQQIFTLQTTGSTIDFKGILNEMVLAHIYEVFGAVVQGSSTIFAERRTEYLEVALDKMWEVIRKLSNSEEEEDFEDEPMSNEETVKYAKKIANLCVLAGNALPKDFIADYESKVVVFKQAKEMEFLEAQAKNKRKFKRFKEKVVDTGTLDLEKINTLRQCDLFLQEETHRKVFFAERIAMILHSMSRLPLCGQALEKNEEYKRYTWYSKLAYEIAVASKTENVTLLTEYLSKVGGFIPLVLKLKTKEDTETTDLRGAKDLCLKVIEQNKASDTGKTRFYEHGFLKQQSGVIAQMQVLRYLVRVNARLYAHDKEKDDFVSKGADVSKQLMSLAEEHHGRVAMSSNCMIYCGKFNAASGQFKEAEECFDTYFKYYKSRAKKNEICWATLNFARAVVAGKLSHRVEEAVKACEEFSRYRSQLPPHLVSLLETEKEKLEGMNPSKKLKSDN